VLCYKELNRKIRTLRKVNVKKNDKKDDLLLIVLVVLLVCGILLTAFCSERKSKHGYGKVQDPQKVTKVSSLFSQRTH
jgi:Na+-transporting NADH:ubiquinone oxidoreductase subunit NqrC